MKLITTCHYNRPACTQSMLDHLSKCVGINEYHVVFFVEPGCSEVQSLIDSCTLNKTVIHNNHLFGCWSNKKQAIKHGFDNTDYLIHLEDDVILSQDALLYFEWAKNVKNVGTVTAYNKNTVKNYIESMHTARTVQSRNWYNSTAWAMHIDKYNIIKNDWTGQDKQLYVLLHFNYNLHEIYPSLSRANNIGYINGIKSAAIDTIKIVGNSAYSPIGLSSSRDSFVSDKNKYLESLKTNYAKNPSEDLRVRIEKCEKYDFDTQLITNEHGEEFVKLDESTYKSRDNGLYYNQYYLNFWAGNYDVMEKEFILI